MPRTHGYSEKGQRCYGTDDWGARGRTNAIGALLWKKLLTVSLFDSNINTDIFKTWIKVDLLPKLASDSVIVMDNASFHKNLEMQNIIKEAGHLLEYLPVYSPDLNPIEKNGLRLSILDVLFLALWMSFFYLISRNSFITL